MKEMTLIAGVDEAGRGPWAGPVFAAAVILNPAKPIAHLADSKKLSHKQREYLFEQVCQDALSFAIAKSTVAEIEKLNILQASLLAMHRAVNKLNIKPELVLVDGKQIPKWSYSAKAVIDGDNLIPAISAASILAKVARDKYMLMLDEDYPMYGFCKHNGYGTPQHQAALKQYGPCPHHRMTFAPLRSYMLQYNPLTSG